MGYSKPFESIIHLKSSILYPVFLYSFHKPYILHSLCRLCLFQTLLTESSPNQFLHSMLKDYFTNPSHAISVSSQPNDIFTSFLCILLDSWSLLSISEVSYRDCPQFSLENFQEFLNTPLKKIKIRSWKAKINCVHRYYKSEVERAETTPFRRRKKLVNILATTCVIY